MHTFIAGQIARAEQVNENFQELKTELTQVTQQIENSLTSRVQQLETRLQQLGSEGKSLKLVQRFEITLLSSSLNTFKIGEHRCAFTTTQPDTNYIVVATVDNPRFSVAVQENLKSTTAFWVKVKQHDYGSNESVKVDVIVLRESI